MASKTTGLLILIFGDRAVLAKLRDFERLNLQAATALPDAVILSLP